jgi:hypothetical protein
MSWFKLGDGVWCFVSLKGDFFSVGFFLSLVLMYVVVVEFLVFVSLFCFYLLPIVLFGRPLLG